MEAVTIVVLFPKEA
uniref:Uncharacterized protein n=1 Tax=Rhizophora mucronata TaxID=61149 RepID=A0A2P2QXE4_RHIMU